MNKEFQRKLDWFFLRCAITGALCAYMASTAHAQYDWTQVIHVGQNAPVRSVNVSSTTGTALWPQNSKRQDSICRNNSAYTIWVGTDSLTYNAVEHPNITNGFPVLSSETFKLGGQLTPAIYGTLTPGQSGTANVRCLDGTDN